MRHAVLGAGGVGGVLGGALARAAHQVTLIVRPGQAGSFPRRLHVESRKLGDFDAEVAVAERLEDPIDVLWITVKATQLEEALGSAPASAVGDARVVPLLNGIDHVARLRTLYGSRVRPATIAVEAERVSPGSYRQSGPFINLRIAGEAADLVEEVAATGITCSLVEDELTMLWQKLSMLAPMALTTSWLRLPVGGVLAEPAGERVLLGVIEEVVAVGRAEGAALDAAAVAAAIRAVPAGMRTSMQKDREAGRPLELDAIAGAVVRHGAIRGVPTPVTKRLLRELGG